jgi:phage/plasmid-like protein (TIGR03299 family)
MVANIETMFSAKETPWHKLGTVTDGVLTSADAIVEAGLDWKVKLKDLYYTSDTTFGAEHKAPSHYATVRTSDESCLGVVGNRYTPVQNSEAFNFMDALVGSGEAKYETAGSIADGKIVWILMKLDSLENNSFQPDMFEPYVLLSNSHDGSSALKVTMTPVRVVCQNTLRMALNGASQQFSMRHTSGIAGKVQQARETLNFVSKYYEAFQDEVERLINKEVTNAEFNSIMEKLFPRPSDEEMEKPRTANNYERIVSDITKNWNGELHKGSAWGVINAFNSYELWQQKSRGEKLERQAKNFINDGQTLTLKAQRLVSAL